MKFPKFKAPYWPKEAIEKEVVGIRAKYPSIQHIPIDVLAFAEFDLGLEFDFAALQQLKQEAFLRPDLSGIWFDEVAFRQPALFHRLRFSAAHELGHYFLHRDIYRGVEFSTVEDWIEFIDKIPPDQYQWIERQADEFAGRFLIPTPDLSKAIDEAVVNAEQEGFFGQGQEEVLEFCARVVHRDFRVSQAAMERRIRKSEFWPHPDLPAS